MSLDAKITLVMRSDRGPVLPTVVILIHNDLLITFSKPNLAISATELTPKSSKLEIIRLCVEIWIDSDFCNDPAQLDWFRM